MHAPTDPQCDNTAAFNADVQLLQIGTAPASWTASAENETTFADTRIAAADALALCMCASALGG